MYSVLFVDDNPIFTLGAMSLIKEKIQDADLYTARTFAEMELMLEKNPYQMLIACLPIDCNVLLDRICNLPKQYNKISIFLFCENINRLPIQQLYQAGILGILDKQAGVEEFKKAILQVQSGNFYLDNKLCATWLLMNKPRYETNAPIKLSNRESAVVKLLLEGKSNIQICQLMHLQPSTVSTFKNKIYKKLKVNNLLELEHFNTNLAYSA